MIKRYKSTRLKRQARIRKHLLGSTVRPRLSVHRSSKHIYAQIIDDSKGITLVSASDHEIKLPAKSKTKPTKTTYAENVGTLLAGKAKKAQITKVVFDRGHYKFHGRVKALAQASKAAGMEF